MSHSLHCLSLRAFSFILFLLLSGLHSVFGSALKDPPRSTLGSHGYVYDVAGQVRTNSRPDAEVIYGYDDIGQLISASGFEANGTTARPQESFEYGYDPGGNLIGRTNNALVQVFTADDRNRLSGLTSGGSVTVAGYASDNAVSVTVNGVNATLYGDQTFTRSGYR